MGDGGARRWTWALAAVAACGVGLGACSTPSTTSATADTPSTAAAAPAGGAASTTPAPEETTTSAASRVADVSTGAAFDEVCTVVAAPQSDQQSTVFNASCPDVPEQYQFVQVQVNDPDLQVSPDAAGVRVQGRVFGTARSQLGYQVVEVLATRVTHVPNG